MPEPSPHSDLDLAYLAGIVDGEGSISMTRIKEGARFSWRVVLRVGTCDQALIERFDDDPNLSVRAASQ